MRVELKNLLILGSFGSVLLLGVLVYYLHQRLIFVEQQDRILEINFHMERKDE